MKVNNWLITLSYETIIGLAKWNEEYHQTKINKLYINFIGANVRSGENIRISPLTLRKVKPSKEIAITLAKLGFKEVIFPCSFLPIYIISLPVLFNSLKYIYIYIYIEREREREREKKKKLPKWLRSICKINKYFGK